MSVARPVEQLVEIFSSSNKSLEDALATGIARAAATVHSQGTRASDEIVEVDDDGGAAWRVRMRLTFALPR